ncbi:hypothetical protein PUH89_04030 [Rhodobacter capsulatus]|uniref:Phage tail assembly chaperone protein, E, or 41 or 14 n=1 Tax=Rhodobacter capsulatus TaxID=1061 RepID=A0A1G7PX14_RHOCA|nr:hypothetical protein [Rhodobacter capsulatus]WER10170.1 hypothetical protein PUH89_04030 [Rhodobacter capsulatus]SDF90179.1 hypothetical protein SAMN04244550_03060 [Rhodobacter capsulatus]
MSGNMDAMGGGGSLMTDAEFEPVSDKITFVDNGRPRTAELPLEWPLQLPAGGRIDVLHLRRLRGSEVAKVQELMLAGKEADVLAVFTGECVEVIEALDQDDMVELKARLADFLPRSLRAALDAAQELMLADLKSRTGEA